MKDRIEGAQNANKTFLIAMDVWHSHIITALILTTQFEHGRTPIVRKNVYSIFLFHAWCDDHRRIWHRKNILVSYEMRAAFR